MLATRHSYLKQSLSALVGLIALTGMTPNAPAQCQLQKLLADDGAAFDNFGFPIAISGDTAVIGAGQFSFFSPGSGVAYVFEKLDGVWTQTAKLTASDWAWGDEFGISVAVSGNTTVIGAHRHTCEGGIEDCGAAYMFEKVGGVWAQTAKLTAADGAVAGFFGASVAISGLTAVIGASGHDALGSFSGSAYVFEKVGGVWTQTAKLTAADGAAFDNFGRSVALSGDTAVIGAVSDGDLGINSGSAYVFEKGPNGVWDNGSVDQFAKLNAADGGAFDSFGRSVALSGDTAVIGVSGDDDLGFNSGSACVFEKIGGVWTQTAKLTAVDGAAVDGFGGFVAVSGLTAVIGARWDDDLGTDSGSAYVFEKVAGVWTQTAKLNADDGAGGDGFGGSVAVSGATAVIGAPFDDDLGSDSGSAYVFLLAGVDGDGVIDACCLPTAPTAELIAGQVSIKNRFLSFNLSGGMAKRSAAMKMGGMAKRSAAMSLEQNANHEPLAAGTHGGAPEYRGLTMPPKASASATAMTQAIRVTFVALPAPFDLLSGQSMWVGAPREVSQSGADVDPVPGFPNFLAATLTCVPHYADWSALGTINVYHENVIPLGTYAIQVINEACGAGSEINFSPALTITNAKWGDTVLDLSQSPSLPPEGVVNIVDAVAVLGAFSNAPGAIVKARADLVPATLDLKINITDVLASLAGFQGLHYSFPVTNPSPCGG